MRFILSSLVASVVCLNIRRDYTPFSNVEIEAINRGLQTVVAVLNDVYIFQRITLQGIPEIVKDQEFDPLLSVIQGSSASNISLGVCNAQTEAAFAVTNMRGLSNISLTAFEVLFGEHDDDTKTLKFSMKGAINPMSLSADISGSVAAHCSFLHTRASFEGSVIGDGLEIELLALGVVEYPLTFTAVNITAVAVDFKDVHVMLDGFGLVFNPIVDAAAISIKGAFQNRVIDIIDELIRVQLQAAIETLLPLTVPIP